MTHEEAIKRLSNVTIYHQGECTREALDMAIKALEKQTPKKPYWEYGVWHCKSCGLDVFRDDFFCPICGQAIDWSDDE